MREITAAEVGKLSECVQALSEYHNKVFASIFLDNKSSGIKRASFARASPNPLRSFGDTLAYLMGIPLPIPSDWHILTNMHFQIISKHVQSKNQSGFNYEKIGLRIEIHNLENGSFK